MPRRKPAIFYDHPAKTAIRDHWMRFIAHQTDRMERGNARVWFLPGPDALELSAYRALNIPTQHLQGFEWNKKRARLIRRRHPELPLYKGSLKRALAEKPGKILASPSWAHLDFDGSIFSFDQEMTEVIRRLSLEHEPILGISSIATRDQRMILRSMAKMSLWKGLFPESFDQGIDLLRAGNERLGLILREPAATYALCRELALFFHILQAFGSRTYGHDDARAAEAFQRDASAILSRVKNELASRTQRTIGRAAAIPLTAADDVRQLFLERKVPVRLLDWSRFACQSDPWRKWRWAWHFRFAASPVPVSLLTWAEQLFFQHPPLHVVDFTGAIVGDPRIGVCRFCPTKKEEKENE